MLLTWLMLLLHVGLSNEPASFRIHQPTHRSSDTSEAEHGHCSEVGAPKVHIDAQRTRSTREKKGKATIAWKV